MHSKTRTRYAVLGGAVLLCSAMPVAAATVCKSLGVSSPQLLEVSFEDGLSDRLLANGSTVRHVGKLEVGFEIDSLCSFERTPGSRRARDGSRLQYNWERLGADEREVRRVLRQWAGATVAAEGILRIEPKPWWRRIKEWLVLGDLRSTESELLEVSYLEVLSEPPNEAYCLGYKGPSLPAPLEAWLKTLEGERKCLEDTSSSRNRECVDPVDSVVWQLIPVENDEGELTKWHWRKVPFHPLPPYATRDVTDFEAIGDSAFFFTLVDDRLYAWTGNESVEIDGPIVDELSVRQQPEDGWVYYRARKPGEDGELLWNALRRVNHLLQPETLWESSQLVLKDIGVFPPYEIRVEQEESSQRLIYDPVLQAWTEEQPSEE